MIEQHWSEALNRWLAPTEHAKLVAHVVRLEQRMQELEMREAKRAVLERVREWSEPMAVLAKRITAVEDENRRVESDAKRLADLERLARDHSGHWDCHAVR